MPCIKCIVVVDVGIHSVDVRIHTLDVAIRALDVGIHTVEVGINTGLGAVAERAVKSGKW